MFRINFGLGEEWWHLGEAKYSMTDTRVFIKRYTNVSCVLAVPLKLIV